MQIQKLKSKLFKALLVVYTILSIASTIYLLVRPCEQNAHDRYEETKQELEAIKSYLRQRDADFEQTVQTFRQKSDSLQRVVRVTDKRLQASRSIVTELSEELTDYVALYDRDTSLRKNEVAFDSLSGMSFSLIDEMAQRDSLCDVENDALRELVTTQDSIIQIGDSLLRDYQSNTDELLQTSNDLNEKLYRTEKKLKRKRQFNRTVVVASLTGGGALILTYLLTH